MMVSDDDCRRDNEENTVLEDVVHDESQSLKEKRGKVPKRVLKAEREKLKRENLNELFTELGSLLELSEQNNGKAAILNETIRLLKDMISQMQRLKKENSTLLSESHYVSAEKNELKDDNSALEAQIKRMQSELEEKLAQSTPNLDANLPECWQAETGSHFLNSHLPRHGRHPFTDPSTLQPPMLAPLYVIPINHDFQSFQKADTVTNPPVPVSKPHPRYPTPADSWPSHLLSKQTATTEESTASLI